MKGIDLYNIFKISTIQYFWYHTTRISFSSLKRDTRTMLEKIESEFEIAAFKAGNLIS